MSGCDCATKLRRGDDVYVRACGCTGFLQRAKVTRVFVRRVWLDRPLDIARCSDKMGMRRFWIDDVHLAGCATEGR